MTLLTEVEEFFGTKNLYEVLNIEEHANNDQIKKAYRKASLKVHPDRVAEDEKEKATRKFQVLSQVHHILSDEERRNLYDNHGIIANEDRLETEADWSNYWRLLFPKVTANDIQGFMDSYIGSAEEQEDLIKLYNRYEGDMDKLSESHIGYDEERTTNLLKRLIEEEKITAYRKFSKESQRSKQKRLNRATREAKQAEKFKADLKTKTGRDLDNMDDLTALIKRRNESTFTNMMASLEARYSSGSKGIKRKRSNRK